jgi:hypothetical protein
MYYFTVLGRMEYEERVKAFEAKRLADPEELPGFRLLSARLFYALKYRLSAPRQQVAQVADKPCLDTREMQVVGQNGC